MATSVLSSLSAILLLLPPGSSEWRRFHERMTTPEELMAYVELDRFAFWKQTAKDKWEASRTDPKQRAIAKWDAVREIVKDRATEFANGRGTLDFALDAALQMLETERALAVTSGEDITALERYWEVLAWMERVNRERYEAQRIPLKDLAQTSFQRQQAEIWLIEAQRKHNTPLWRGLRPRHNLLVFPLPLDAMDVKYLAKAKRTASRAQPRDLAADMVANGKTESNGRLSEFFNGRGTMDFLLEASQNQRNAEYHIAESPRKKLDALEEYWHRCLVVETVNVERYSAGRVNIRDRLRPTYRRCDAERQMLLARREQNEQRIPVGYDVLQGSDPKELAKEKWRAVHADPVELAKEKRDAAAVIVDTGMKEFLNGRGTLLFMLESIRQLTHAIQEADPSESARVAAASTYWTFAKITEMVSRERRDARRIPDWDYFEAKYALLNADDLLARAMKWSKDDPAEKPD